MLGQTIGNYRITATIGEGGMGAVYRMVHESLGRAAAVKVLLPAISSNRDMVTRFFNEARSAASIRHPGIVEVFDFGFLPDGQAYIIMEHLEGESLGSRLRRLGRLPHTSALQIMRLVGRALHAAHERGIVHRDLKPDNIFLVPDPDMPTGERIKLLDFGIAKLGADGSEPSLTQTGTVMGTPTYMAPEQCRGAGAVDRRADLYALGCILYELLCGRPPFVAEGAGDLIARQLYFQPEPPRAFDPSITPELEALVMSLLQKDPAHRPPTALALVEAIDRLGLVPASIAPAHHHHAGASPAGAPVTTLSGAAAALGTQPGSRPGRGGKLAAAIAGAVLVLGGAAVAVVALTGRGSKDSPVAAAPGDAAPEPPRADAAEVAHVPPPADAAIAPEAPADAAEAPPTVAIDQPPGPTAEDPRKAGETRRGQGPRKGDKTIGQAPPDEASAATAAKLNEEGKNLVFRGKYAEASAKFRQATALARQPLYFINLCVSLYQEGKFGEALSACHAVAKHNPTAEQREKANKMTARIKQEAARQKIQLQGD